MSRDCDRIRVKTRSRKFDKWECIWCGQRQTVRKGQPPKDTCGQIEAVRLGLQAVRKGDQTDG